MGTPMGPKGGPMVIGPWGTSAPIGAQGVILYGDIIVVCVFEELLLKIYKIGITKNVIDEKPVKNQSSECTDGIRMCYLLSFCVLGMCYLIVEVYLRMC